jgi:hypothetical protein
MMNIPGSALLPGFLFGGDTIRRAAKEAYRSGHKAPKSHNIVAYLT